MPYRKLSEQVAKLSNPQRSDIFVRQFRAAVRDGQFDAVYLPDRFELPKIYSKRGEDGNYRKDSKDMVFELTPEFEEWFQNIDQELNQGRRTKRIKPSLEAYEQGLIDFKAAAEETRRKMLASQEKGERLGKSRSGGSARKSKTTSRKSKK
ncbi:hypothetical protein HNR42_003029 [Deinobacterium chartae]|uniref:Uncharacterized protein n=1 Tax=Deinobacterium chartae TaxID=521158 RepID=A0A841I3F3_9DEIO|nr:hypothetical protein [Deinobacterium chartae]MBB6099576.1 hypothetical protein [Deinobacterium chartae]